jgi:DNA-binding transcriptional ArsR family regulator
VLAPLSWIAVVGAWRWRGRNRAKWTASGLSEDLFRSLIRMKGGKTRVLLMGNLAAPKDRFRLAQELKLDWKTVDYEIKVLLRHGLIAEHLAYGDVRLYKTTPIGSLVLKLVKELSEPLNPEFKAGSDVSDTKPESVKMQFD